MGVRDWFGRRAAHEDETASRQDEAAPAPYGPPRDVEEFRGRLRRAGLDELAGALVALARPSARLGPDPAADATATATTRLGGEPDLPAGTDWPRKGGRPLSFVLQVDLADVAPLVEADALPPAGLLSFFYDAVQQPWGFDPADRGSWAVLHHPPGESLERRPFPADLADEGRFGSLSVVAAAEATFPPAESEDVRALGIEPPDPAWHAYRPVLGETDDERITRILGQPDPVQGDMQHECQLASNGVYCGSSSYSNTPGAKALLAEAGRWRLLAQVDSYEQEIGMMWGDLGRIYFWIRDDDLRERRWDRTWLVLQCG